MSSASPSFPYRPLDTSVFEIRLITIQPRDPASPELITCSLGHVRLDDPDSIYEALSYEWGAQTETPCSIILNDIHLPVREKLFSALWYLRDQGDISSVRILWIDALCINQSNDIEKSHQVAQMGNIYSHAWQVVAWVGLETQHIPKSRRDPLLPWDQRDSAACSTSRMNDLVDILRDPSKLTFDGPSDYRKWGCILAFCDRTYWTRLWIIQEVILAPHIVVQGGAYSFDFTLLEKAFEKHMVIYRRAFADKYKSSMDFIADTTLYNIFAQRGKRQKNNNTLLDNVHLYRESFCFDPRDRIFGVLEIGPACCKAKISISYQKSEWENLESLFHHHFQDHQSSVVNDLQLRSLFYYFSQRGQSPRSWTVAVPSEIFLEAGHSTVATVRCNLLGVILAYDKGQNELLVGHYTSEETNILYSKQVTDSNLLPSARVLDSNRSSEPGYFEGTSTWPNARQLRDPTLRDGYDSFRCVWDSSAAVYGWTNYSGAVTGGPQPKYVDLVTEEMPAINTYGDTRPGDLICSLAYGGGVLVLRWLDNRLVVVMVMKDRPLFPNERWRWERRLYLDFAVLRAYHEFMMFGPGSSFEISGIDHAQATGMRWD